MQLRKGLGAARNDGDDMQGGGRMGGGMMSAAER